MTETQRELAPCPFCGSKAEILTLEGETDDPSIGAQCVQCTSLSCGAASGLVFPLMDNVTDLLAERWNRRALTQPQAQQAVIDYVPGTWFKSQSVDQTQDFYLSRLPEIREAAREHGYAIGVHGSTRRDFDLIAMQWREGASDKDTLAHAIAMAACGIDRQGAYEWEEKGAGRVACSIPICWTPHPSEVGAGHIDLSLIKAQQAAAVPAGWREFIENIATAGSEPLNSLAGGSDKASRRRWLSVIRDKASDLLSSAPAAPQSDDELLAQALGALQYHTEQTRPIERTRLAIEAIDRRLHGGITGGEEPTP